MRVIVTGGSGAAGHLLLRQLLDRGIDVTALVRSKDRVPGEFLGNPDLWEEWQGRMPLIYHWDSG